MKKISPILEIGDEIVLVDMNDPYSPLPPGTKGVVIKKNRIFGDLQYSIDWENGSTLDLIEGVDSWVLSKDFNNKSLKESQSSAEEEMNFFMTRLNRFRNYDTRYLRDYLMKVRDSGITNMFGAAKYLYMGKDRIYHEFKYSEQTEDNDAYEDVLEMADKAQSIMINGVIKDLEQKNSSLEIDNINRELHKAANDILNIFFRLF